MSADLQSLEQEARAAIAAAADGRALSDVRVRYLGRKGVLQELMGRIPTLPLEERRAFGASVNALKRTLEEAMAVRAASFDAGGGEKVPDVTLPGLRPLTGRRHPLMQGEQEICSVFGRLGFKVFRGPEIETEFNNFEALHIPLDHPSRDAFDTFYLAGGEKEPKRLLRSHTSPSQIRALKECPPPMAVVVPGRVYRPDAVDASHSFMFHQVEGLAVDKDIRFSDLKGLLVAFARAMFGAKTRLRFRPSFFPFTEPSAEMDISCFLCKAKGCPVCKRSGWLEILGCGMVHPHVLRSAGVDPARWRGYAFGMGVERIVMLKHGIT
ncbi:MAG: phenylalanine--tRNA ligase subunit alpha, partial [Deltaproteobacteria bacterium]